jgi:hypothetical protein
MVLSPPPERYSKTATAIRHMGSMDALKVIETLSLLEIALLLGTFENMYGWNLSHSRVERNRISYMLN